LNFKERVVLKKLMRRMDKYGKVSYESTKNVYKYGTRMAMQGTIGTILADVGCCYFANEFGTRG
jgi:hypothetical protein